AAYGAVLASAFWFGLHLTLEPPIVGHQMLLGYFSGSIYDEALAVPSSLVAYRGMNALWLAAALAGLEVRRAVDRGGAVGWPLVAAVALTVGAAGLWYYRKPLGVGIDRGYVADQLGGRTTTEHFVIHYPQTRRFLRQVERLERDHEFRYREMRAFFETDPADGGRLHSFVYPDRDTKARLMGGRSTMVAKLWLGEIHVLWPRYGHHLLAHELAHLFTEPFGAGPLSLSITNGIGVNMGLVEGVATAADRPPNELTLHEASAAMRRLEMAPDVVDIVGAGGFWTSASGRAYTVAGSFVRFLVDRHGIQALKRAYPRGDFRGAYGEPLSALVESWHASLDSVDLTEAEMDRARYLYRESTIFEKTCARSAAEVRRRARLAAARGEPVEARRLFDRLVAYAPDNLDYRIEAVDQLLKAGDIDGARERIEELLSRDLKPGRRARVIELEGDAAWRAGQLSRARSSYRQARGIGLPSAMQRRIEAKLRALESGEEIRRLAFEYLLARNPATIDVFYPTEWYRREPESALAAYLVGRRLWSARKWRRAVTFLDAARGGLEGTLLAAEVRFDANGEFPPG
ncbi:MAG: tetratricopeptide repeat protein, partial [Bradymonadaceae bacterium]